MFCKLEMFFQKQDYYIWMKRNNINGENHKINCYETRGSMVETGKFYIKLFMSICTRDPLSHKFLKSSDFDTTFITISNITTKLKCRKL